MPLLHSEPDVVTLILIQTSNPSFLVSFGNNLLPKHKFLVIMQETHMKMLSLLHSSVSYRSLVNSKMMQIPTRK